MRVHEIPADYDSTIGTMQNRMRRSPAGPAGDPGRAAEIIVNTVKRDNLPSHLLLGVNAVEMAVEYSKRQLAESTLWQNVSRSADYAEPYPAEYPADEPAP
jgi:Zn-dependent M28 family amino/carboxypeptidase